MSAVDPASPRRDLDLVLFGATGVTGRLVARHLAARAPRLRWALAGRDLARLAAVRDELRVDVALLTADASSASAAHDVAARARVVCSAAGPFGKLGLALVRACAEHGTHYCDVAGEPLFLRASIDAVHARAHATGARIVHACGFDSVPSDLGVHALHRHVASRGDALASTRYRVVALRGALSAGTLATLVEQYAASSDPETRARLDDVHLLDPDVPPDRRVAHRDPMGPRLDRDTGRFTAPFVMAPINTRVVRRTDALLGYAYGPAFRYDEALDIGPGPLGLARATAIGSALASLYAVAVNPLSRAAAARLLPLLGTTPADGAGFRVEIRADTVWGRRVRAVVAAPADPGYEATAWFLGESALSLAHDPLATPGGVTTPAAALGETLPARLRDVGLTLRVEVPVLRSLSPGRASRTTRPASGSIRP